MHYGTIDPNHCNPPCNLHDDDASASPYPSWPTRWHGSRSGPATALQQSRHAVPSQLPSTRGQSAAIPRDIRDLSDLYEVTDPGQRERLMTLAREGKQRGWWQDYDLGRGCHYSMNRMAD